MKKLIVLMFLITFVWIGIPWASAWEHVLIVNIPTLNEDETPYNDAGTLRIYNDKDQNNPLIIPAASGEIIKKDTLDMTTYSEGESINWWAVAVDINNNPSINSNIVTITAPMVAPKPPSCGKE